MSWLGGWQNRIAITIDKDRFDASLSHFPIMVRLSASCGQSSQDLTGVFDELGANSLKIAVTSDDALSQLYVEIDQWDSGAEEAILWISKSGWSISDTTDTVVYLYYDNNHADNSDYVGLTNSTPAENVWDANFKAVYHMADGADTSHIYDSTSNNNDGTKKGANEPQQIAGQVGYAQDFDGGDDWIDVGFNFSSTEATFSILFKTDQIAGGFPTKVLYFTTNGGQGYFRLNTSGYIRYYNVGTNNGQSNQLTDWVANTYYLITVVYDGTEYKIYRNGIYVGGTERTGTLAFTVLWIARDLNWDLVWYEGVLDHHSISDTNRSAAWIAATYESLWDDLLGFGDAELATGVNMNGIEVQIRKRSLSVDTRIEERSTARFDIVDTLGTANYQRGEPLWIYDLDSDLIFGGFVAESKEIRMSPDGGLYHSIKCMDYHYCTDKRLVAESYEDRTCGYIVQDIFDIYLDDEGVTVGTIEAGPTLVEAIFNYVRASDALDALAEKAGKIWYIDENKALYFVARTTASAPWNATGDDFLKGATRYSNKNSQYRNRQYIRGGRDTTDQQTENFTGDGVTVAFTVGYPIVKVPSVEVDSVVQTVGIKGLDTAKDCYWNKGDATITFETAPPNTDDVEIVYYGQFDVLIVVENLVEVATQAVIEGSGTGYVDDMDDEAALNDRNAALDSGEAKVERFGLSSKRLTYKTTRLGLRPGQTQTITYPTHRISALDMLIESVRIQGFGSEMISTVTAVVGPDMGSWAKYFLNLSSMKDKIMDRLNVGANQILIILVARSEIWEWGEDITVTPAICPIPSTALYPKTTLYPC